MACASASLVKSCTTSTPSQPPRRVAGGEYGVSLDEFEAALTATHALGAGRDRQARPHQARRLRGRPGALPVHRRPRPQGDGKRDQRCFTYDSLKQARAERARIIAETTTGSYVKPDKKTTVSEFLTGWLDGREIKPSTRRFYLDRLRPVAAAYGNLPLQNLTVGHERGEGVHVGRTGAADRHRREAAECPQCQRHHDRCRHGVAGSGGPGPDRP
jgi:hypothetical protein